MDNDVDSVLFLVGIEVDVNSRIQDGTHRTSLHLAVPTGNEIIVRHLVRNLYLLLYMKAMFVIIRFEIKSNYHNFVILG